MLPRLVCSPGWLAVVGHLGALLRVDLELGEVAVLQRGWTNGREKVHDFAALPTGEVRMYAGPYLRVGSADLVPQDGPALHTWLTTRAR